MLMRRAHAHATCPCSCDVRAGWSGNTLVGTIPSSFYNLTELEHLYLSNDRPGWSRLHGTVSTEIGRLHKLKCLYLSHAGALTGTLPTEIGSLTRLQGIYTRWTSLGGPLPDLSRLRNLSKLVIDAAPLGSCPPFCQSSFSGTLAPLAAARLPFEHLDVAGNRFSGHFPTELCTIHHCTAWGNHFTDPQRPRGCCDGVDAVGALNTVTERLEDDFSQGGNECYEHAFPGRVIQPPLS